MKNADIKIGMNKLKELEKEMYDLNILLHPLISQEIKDMVLEKMREVQEKINAQKKKLPPK
jgi:hypothetical protein